MKGGEEERKGKRQTKKGRKKERKGKGKEKGKQRKREEESKGREERVKERRREGEKSCFQFFPRPAPLNSSTVYLNFCFFPLFSVIILLNMSNIVQLMVTISSRSF